MDWPSISGSFGLDSSVPSIGSEMPAYVVAQITVRDAEMYERYKELAPPSISAYGGKYIARGGTTMTLCGAWHPTRLVILEFPTMERARQWWDSPEYGDAKLVREASADAEIVLIDGLSAAASAALSGAGSATAKP
jgi:uncharacterized protein (DUF1330 family)